MQQHIVEQLDGLPICRDPTHAVELGRRFVSEQQRGQCSNGHVCCVAAFCVVRLNGACSLMKTDRVCFVVPWQKHVGHGK